MAGSWVRLRGRRALAVAVITVLAGTVDVEGQHPFVPGPSFGAYTFAHTTTDRNVWSIQTDLLTELGKELEPYPDFIRYNDIQKTIGATQIGYTRSRNATLGRPDLLFGWTLSGSVGVIWDGPTELLQNDFAHQLRKITYVPRDSAAGAALIGLGGDAGVIWIPTWSRLRFRIQGGGAGGASTAFFDGAVHGGAEIAHMTGGGGELFLVGGAARLGAVRDVVPQGWVRDHYDEGLHDGFYTTLQYWGTIPLDNLPGTPWLPRVRITMSHLRGVFAKVSGGGKKGERYVSLQLESVNGRWSLETWNDLGTKDHGPSFGLRAQVY